MIYVPISLVWVRFTTPVALLVTLTAAAGTTELVPSVTVPEMPLNPCACVKHGSRKRTISVRQVHKPLDKDAVASICGLPRKFVIADPFVSGLHLHIFPE